MNWLDLFSSVFSGGLTGLLGIVVQRGADIWNKKQDLIAAKDKMAHDEAMRRIDGELLDKEWAHRTQIAEVEAKSAEDTAESAAFAKSYDMGTKLTFAPIQPGRVGSFLLIIVDVLKEMVRPGLTVYLCVLTTLIYFQAEALIHNENLDAVQALDIEHRIIDTILYLCITVVLWWFGTRNKQAAPQTART